MGVILASLMDDITWLLDAKLAEHTRIWFRMNKPHQLVDKNAGTNFWPTLFPNFARRISKLIYDESVIFVNEKKGDENFWHIWNSKFSSTNFELETNRNLPLPNPQSPSPS